MPFVLLVPFILSLVPASPFIPLVLLVPLVPATHEK